MLKTKCFSFLLSAQKYGDNRKIFFEAIITTKQAWFDGFGFLLKKLNLVKTITKNKIKDTQKQRPRIIKKGYV